MNPVYFIFSFSDHLRTLMTKLSYLFLITVILFTQCKDGSKDQLQSADHDPIPETIIVPASDFVYELPKGDILASSWSLREEWVFNNTAIVLNSLSNLMTHVTVPTDGKYQLFVRSKGNPNGSFKVAINDQVTETIFGYDSLMTWKPGGSFELKAGENVVKITRINRGQHLTYWLSLSLLLWMRVHQGT